MMFVHAEQWILFSKTVIEVDIVVELRVKYSRPIL